MAFQSSIRFNDELCRVLGEVPEKVSLIEIKAEAGKVTKVTITRLLDQGEAAHVIQLIDKDTEKV